MIEEKDIIIFDEYTSKPNGIEVVFNRGYISHKKLPDITIFGQEPFGKEAFDEEDLEFELIFPKDMNITDMLVSVNVYLNFLADCNQTLTNAYKRNAPEIEMTTDWYETLEIYSGSIFIDVNGIPSGNFSSGDNIVTDHLLMIEFDHKEISQMYFEG